MSETLKDQVGKWYSDYGKYINRFRSFPLIYDGLKLVERRILISLSIEAKGKFTKSARVTGHCMGNLHPHCLAGDTKICLLDGTEPTIQWLAENKANEEFWVYSCDPVTGKIVPAKAKLPRIGQVTDTMYQIYLDNDTVVECTANHPFMLRYQEDNKAATYVRADQLQVGMSLRPLYITPHSCNGKTYYNAFSTYSKTKAVHQIVGEFFNGEIDQFHAFHHKDFNPRNNVPENIIRLTRSEHAKIHVHEDPAFKKIAMEALAKGRATLFDKDGIHRQMCIEKNSKLMTRVNKTLQLTKAIKLVKYLATQYPEVTEELYNKHRKSFGYNYATIKILIQRGHITSFDDLKQKAQINHTITDIKVIKLDKAVNFYDLTVDKYNNFAISQGVFVHNSDAYGTLVQLANNGLVDKQGNFGIAVGIHDEPAAASRYTEVRMNQEVYDEAFSMIKYVKEEDLEMNPEPLYLPVMLPICLRLKNYCQGIGFGYRTYIPSYTKSDLIKRLDWLLHDKTGDGPIIKPLTDCQLAGSNADYKQLLTTGKASIVFKGKLQQFKDAKCVYVYSIPPNKKFQSIINSFKDEITVQKSIGFLDESKTSTKVKFMLTKRGQNLDKLYKKLQQKTSGSVTFECNMCDLEGNVVLVSVDQMLLNTYQMYKSINELKLKDNINKLQNEIDELVMMQKIKKVLPDLLKLYPDDLDKLVEGIVSKTDVPEEDVRRILEKYTIHKFMKAKIDIDGKTNALNTEKQNLSDLDNFVWQKYQH